MVSNIGKRPSISGSKKKRTLRFSIDCSRVVEDKVLSGSDFNDFLNNTFKVNKKTGNLGEDVKINFNNGKIYVVSDVHFSKRYLKYLTKKFLKRHNLRDWVRVVASNKSAYQLRYFHVYSDNEEDEK